MLTTFEGTTPFVRNAGSVGARGFGLSLGRRFGGVANGSVTYTFGRGRRSGSIPSLADAPVTSFDDAEFHDLVARLETVIDWSDTRVAALCRLSSLSDDRGPAAAGATRTFQHDPLRRPAHAGAAVPPAAHAGRLGGAGGRAQHVLRGVPGRLPGCAARFRTRRRGSWGVSRSVSERGDGAVGRGGDEARGSLLFLLRALIQTLGSGSGHLDSRAESRGKAADSEGFSSERQPCPRRHVDCYHCRGSCVVAGGPREPHEPRRLKNTLVVLAGSSSPRWASTTSSSRRPGPLLDDGVFWKEAPEGVVAARVAPAGPAARAGVRPATSCWRSTARRCWPGAGRAPSRRRQAGERVRYSLLRADEKRALDVQRAALASGQRQPVLLPLPGRLLQPDRGHDRMMRRPADRAPCTSTRSACSSSCCTRRPSRASSTSLDWTLFWADHLAILFLPVVFLHFCLSFPERRSPRRAAWLMPAAYMPALVLAGAAVASQVLFVRRRAPGRRSGASPTPSTGSSRSTSRCSSRSPSSVLLDSYRRTRSLVTARQQMKWLVWGTGAGVLPFFVFYAIPFALGREPAARHGAGWATSRSPSSRSRSPTRW